MKKLFFVLSVCISVATTFAQNYDEIKSLLILNKLDKAKSEVDKAFANTKSLVKAEVYILKASIYASLAMTYNNIDFISQYDLANEAHIAFLKYKELDPLMRFLNDFVYQNAPINLYSCFYSSGYNDYTAKKWDPAFTKIRNAIEYSDLLIEKKVLTTPIDTNLLILAGVIAEHSNHIDDAAKYYGRIADNKITGDGFENIYRFLVSYYYEIRDIVFFEKYKRLGIQLFPQSDFFKSIKELSIKVNSNIVQDSRGDVVIMQEHSSGTYLVLCEVNGLRLSFIFDSGASDVSISLTEASFMLKNGYLSTSDIIDIQKYQIANGQLAEGYVINIRELKIGNQTLNNVRGSIVKSLNSPLLLGMTAIKKLGFKFDPVKGVLYR